MNALLENSRKLHEAENNYELYNIDKMIENNKDKIVKLPVAELHDFSYKGVPQPFLVNSKKLKQIARSMQQYGQLTPCGVRKMPDGSYELLTGMTRRRAAVIIDCPTLDCVVFENIDDEKAFEIMKNSNIQRDKPLPSELARLVEQTKQVKKETDTDITITDIAEMYDVSRKHIYRCYNVLKLPQSLQNAVDMEYISTTAIEKIINNLTYEQQEELGEYIEFQDKPADKKLSPKKLNKVFELANYTDEEFSVDNIKSYLSESEHKTDENDMLDAPVTENKFASDYFNELLRSYPQLKIYNDEGLERYISRLIKDDLAKEKARPF